ncbi:MAG: bifunctional phosphoribosylaminoimidazolecarboxamide formyltransferase/IMP cyclohydrolase [Rickettsiales bacterium]
MMVFDKKYALLSVSDKTGIADLARGLISQGYALLSSGGTYALLIREGIEATEVSAYTGSPEMMDGRVKTLHPKIHGGLLALRDDAEHVAAMKANAIYPIDVVAVNLYPFEETVASGADEHAIIENIDIGGPSMMRSAAKNCAFVTVLTSPDDYAPFLRHLEANQGEADIAFRKKMALKTFRRTASYDAAIQRYLGRTDDALFPSSFTVTGTRLGEALRYGENPHQAAAFYVTEPGVGIGGGNQLHGKQLSYNNIADADAALALASEFSRPAVAIIKHANPCGAAEADNLEEAYANALRCDPVSAFGGVVALNRSIGARLAEEMAALFYEVIVAPDFTPEALEILSRKKNVRLLKTPLIDAARRGLHIKTVCGGFLAQECDRASVTRADCRVVTKRAPSDREWKDLLFAFTVAKHVRSNAIVLANDGATVGVGAGQMSRVDATEIACRKATLEGNNRAAGAVLASDAFFPFADGPLIAARAGVTAIIQPGGSVRDEETIEAADVNNITMVFTGTRSFKH